MALLWASLDDVKDRWLEGEIPATDTQLTTLLEDAEDTILGEFPNLQDRIDDGELPERRVVKVATRVVIRHLRNPNGVRTTQHIEGPYHQSVTFGGDEPGALYLTDADRAELQGRSFHGAFTIDAIPRPYPSTEPDPWEPMP